MDGSPLITYMTSGQTVSRKKIGIFVLLTLTLTAFICGILIHNRMIAREQLTGLLGSSCLLLIISMLLSAHSNGTGTTGDKLKIWSSALLLSISIGVIVPSIILVIIVPRIIRLFH